MPVLLKGSRCSQTPPRKVAACSLPIAKPSCHVSANSFAGGAYGVDGPSFPGTNYTLVLLAISLCAAYCCPHRPMQPLMLKTDCLYLGSIYWVLCAEIHGPSAHGGILFKVLQSITPSAGLPSQYGVVVQRTSSCPHFPLPDVDSVLLPNRRWAAQLAPPFRIHLLHKSTRIRKHGTGASAMCA